MGQDLERGLGLRLLLDTHAVYWALAEPRRLSNAVTKAIRDPANDVFVSSVSLYELTFKTAIRKLKLRPNVASELARSGFAQLPLTWEHSQAAGALPLHHRDPFDRMLVAQAQLEGLTIITGNKEIARYQVAILPA